MKQTLPVMDRLRDETRREHRQIEALPFFTALTGGDLPIAAYAEWLQSLHTVYAAFEGEMQRAQHPQIVAVWDAALHKLPLIQQDLASLQPHLATELTLPRLRAELVAQRIRQRAIDHPSSLLGYLYVLEGSTLGGVVLHARVARSLGLQRSGGLAFLGSYGKATRAHWTAFTQRMNQAGLSEAEQDEAISAAREAFDGVAQIVEALYPVSNEPPADLVRALNPDAGMHAISLDPRELEAALRAGERSWREFPYYEWRYGERGMRFTRSDSAWLVTLADYAPVVAERQVLWLGRVLASRGMPQWMLERHLDVLYEELVAHVPEKQAAYTTLRDAAHLLRELRRRHLGDAQFNTLRADFDRRVGREWAARLPHTGGLLAAAVVDERDGIVKAVSSIEAWITDPARFPAEWIDAVHDIIRRAREHTP
jgi:heme oxygenase